MKKLFPLLLALIWSASALALSYNSIYGRIELPDEAEISRLLQSTGADGALSDEERAQSLAALNAAQGNLAEIASCAAEREALAEEIDAAPDRLRQLQNDLALANAAAALPPAGDPEAALTEYKAEKQRLEEENAAVSAELNKLQTLPELTQSTVSGNQNRIKVLESELTDGLSDLSNRLKALEIYALTERNGVLSARLAAISTLSGLSETRARVIAARLATVGERIALAQNLAQEEREARQSGAQSGSAAAQIPELEPLTRENARAADSLSQRQERVALLERNVEEIDSALNQVKQIQRSLETQLNELSSSLVLSRLLNKQQSVLPQVKLRRNPDESIPNLNIELYEIKEQRDALFDVQGNADALIKASPQLAEHSERVRELLSERLDLYNELYQRIADELNALISLKSKYEQLTELTRNVSGLITEKLFWVPSNQALNLDFCKTLIPNLMTKLGFIRDKLTAEDFGANTRHTVFSILRLLLIALIILYFRPRLIRLENRLAARLDHRDDALYVTPLALLVNYLLIIPKIVWLFILGTLLVVLLLNRSEAQMSVLAMLSVHIVIFAFFMNILRANGLAQRHFSVPPLELSRKRSELLRVWYAVLPILVMANIAESDSVEIYYDIPGYLIIMICCAVLLYLAVKWAYDQFLTGQLSAATWMVSCCALMPAAILIMLVTGYYYTAVKLINRMAYTFYLGLLYWLLLQLSLRSELTVLNRLRRKRLAHEEGHLMEKLNFEYLAPQIFKCVNGALLLLTAALMYQQWNDLAGVLGYFDTVDLWTAEDIVNGQQIISDRVTLGDLLLALIILALTGFLKYSLPRLLEKGLLLGSDSRSTGYTVRIISSYIIMALGLIMAAGTLGIKWENLQWLVAALSVGLGFGLQEIFANFVSGLIILFERQIRVGDIITLDANSGTVSKIRIRATTIVSFENKEVMIPNKQFITSALTNWSLSNTITKIEFTAPIAYDADYRRAKELLRGIIDACPYLSKSLAPMVYIGSLGDSSVNLQVEVFVEQIGDRRSAFDYLYERILSVFNSEGIEIPYNRLVVSLRDPTPDELKAALRGGALKG